MVKIGHAEDFVQSSLARYGIYGRNGAGKTTFLTTLETEKLLVVSDEGQNTKPLLGYQDRIKVAKVSKWDEVDEIYRILVAGKGGNGPSALAFDGWPMRLIINKVTGAHLEQGDEAEWLSKPPDQYPGNWDAWEKVAGLSNYGMLCFMRLPTHLIVCFDEEEPKFDKGIISKKGGPLLPTQALRGAKRQLEFMGRLFAELKHPPLDDVIPETAEETRRMLVGEHELWYAKGPVHAVGYCINNPTWSKLLPALSAAPLNINGHTEEEGI